MKEGAIMWITVTICINIDVTKARLNITGPGTNITGLLLKIYLKGIGEWVPNLLPDMTFNDKTRDRKPGVDAQVGRRSLKKFLSDQRKYFSEAADIFVQPYYQPKEEDNVENTENGKGLKDLARRLLTAIGLKSHAPTRRKAVNAQDQAKIDYDKLLVNKQHENKMNELKYFMEHNYKATDYFYSELKRIQKTMVVIDDLRKMVDWIGKHDGEYAGIKYAFKCFHDRRLKDPAVIDIWKNRVPNNLRIDPMKEPHEYGVRW